MAHHQITDYYASWNYKKHSGHFVFYWEGGNNIIPGVEITDPAEYQVMLDLLRNEKPLWWNSNRERLSTMIEPIGEGENSDDKS